MAGRPTGPTGVRLTEEHRAKIANSNILNRLIDHALGKVEMSATQATVAIALMRKVLPDLQATTHSGDADNPVQFKVSISVD